MHGLQRPPDRFTPEHPLRVHHPQHRPVDPPLEHREPRQPRLIAHLKHPFARRIHIEPRKVHPRRHDLLHPALRQHHDRPQQILLPLVDHPLARPHLQKRPHLAHRHPRRLPLTRHHQPRQRLDTPTLQNHNDRPQRLPQHQLQRRQHPQTRRGRPHHKQLREHLPEQNNREHRPHRDPRAPPRPLRAQRQHTRHDEIRDIRRHIQQQHLQQEPTGMRQQPIHDRAQRRVLHRKLRPPRPAHPEQRRLRSRSDRRAHQQEREHDQQWRLRRIHQR